MKALMKETLISGVLNALDFFALDSCEVAKFIAPRFDLMDLKFVVFF
jgi:hypothetical protein